MKTLQDLDGFSPKLFAEFIAENCLSVSLHHYDDPEKLVEEREKIGNMSSQNYNKAFRGDDLAFLNMELPTEEFFRGFQVSQPVMIFPASFSSKRHRA